MWKLNEQTKPRKPTELLDTEKRMVVTRGKGEDSEKVQTSSCKRNKSYYYGDVMYSMEIKS